MNTKVNHDPMHTTMTEKHIIRRTLEILAIPVLCFYLSLCLASGYLAIQLNKGPVNLGPILPFIEKVMSQSERMQFRISGATLTWQGRHNPLALEMNDIKLAGTQGEFLTIDRADLGISIWPLLFAQLRFSYAEVQNLAIRVIRLSDSTLTLTGNEKKQTTTATSVPLKLNNIIHDLPAIADLKLLNVQLTFEDQKDAVIRNFNEIELQMKQSRGLYGREVTGSLATMLNNTAEQKRTSIGFAYSAKNKALNAAARLNQADTRSLIGDYLYEAGLPIIDMMVEGEADIRLKNDFSLENLSLHLKGNDGTLQWPHSYGAGLESQKLTNFDLRVGYVPQTQTLELSNAEITMKGITVSAKGALSANNTHDQLTGDINVSIPVLAVDALPAVWPKAWDTGGRDWLVERMNNGRFAHINVHVPLTADRETTLPDEIDFELALDAADMEPAPEKKWVINPGSIKGTFDYTGVSVDYRNPMLPATNTTGTGVFEGLGLTLNIKSANIGKLNVTSGKLYFDDLITPGTGHAHLNFNLNGDVGAVFNYLEREPISYRKKVALDASNAKGQANVKLKIDFPTLHDMKVDDVHVSADAILKNLTVPGAVKGLTLSGPSFHLTASENDFKISGEGTLEGAPAKIEWAEIFTPKSSDPYSSKLEAHIDTDKKIREKFLGALEARVDGIIPADISLITTPNGKGILNVTATLTNAEIDFKNPFNATKEKGKTATAKLQGTLQQGYIQSIDSLTISGNDMNLSSANLSFGRDAQNDPVLTRAVLKGLRLGQNNADIDASWPNPNSLKAVVTGTSFDARNIMGGDTSTQGNTDQKTAYDINLKLDQLFLAETPLEKVTASFVGDAAGRITLAEMDASAQGTPVTLRYSGTGGSGDRLLLEADNAGAGLSALGITTRVRDGHLRVTGSPTEKGAPGDMNGKLLLEKFSVRGAPVLAKLINLLSLPGILSILNQDTGLSFERAESDIAFLNKAGGAEIIFADGRTSGASLGLTFEGSVNTATSTMAIQGTVVPMSEVNSLISHIPLIGDILTGGAKGSGIFAATYSMKGPSANPDVSVNPLSVLTPGILRRILFEGALTPKQP